MNSSSHKAWYLWWDVPTGTYSSIKNTFLLEEKALLLSNGRNGWESTGLAGKHCPDWHPLPILMGMNRPTVPHHSTTLFSQSHPSAPTPRSHPETGDGACCTAPWPSCLRHNAWQVHLHAAEAAGLGLPVRTHGHQHLISCCGHPAPHLTLQDPLLDWIWSPLHKMEHIPDAINKDKTLDRFPTLGEDLPLLLC